MLSACATRPEAASVAPVVAAERAFAADAAAMGWIPAFRAFTAPDGIVLQPDPVNAAETFAALPDDGNRSLQWWPAYAGIARSGDLGFTTGPYVAGESDQPRGHYFTVWRRQPDGQWRWIFDGGVPVRDASPIARDAEPAALPAATRGRSEARALNEIAAIERGFAARAGRDVADPYRAFLAEDGRVNRAGAPPAVGKDAALAAVGGGAVQFERLGGAASSAGDLAFSYGEARWGDRRGHYCRIWQFRPEGWRIVFDQIIPRPPEASAG
ncbi:MAG: hypothetical protein JNJ73_00500 [Hyphomonadaceae bacterium]|nr:hypothetical protein [Hyphomonadaceae bacterium]